MFQESVRIEFDQHLDKLVEVLQEGEENAIKAKDLEFELEFDEAPGQRNIRKLMQYAILEHNFPIGSCNDGFYLISTHTEFNAVVTFLEGKRDGIQDRIDAIKEGWNLIRC